MAGPTAKAFTAPLATITVPRWVIPPPAPAQPAAATTENKIPRTSPFVVVVIVWLPCPDLLSNDGAKPWTREITKVFAFERRSSPRIRQVVRPESDNPSTHQLASWGERGRASGPCRRRGWPRGSAPPGGE